MRFFFCVSRTFLSVAVPPYNQKHFTRLSSTVMASRKPFIAPAINKQQSITSTKFIHVYINADATLTSFYRCSFAKAKKMNVRNPPQDKTDASVCVASNSMVHYRVHNSPPIISVPIQINRMYALPFSSISLQYCPSFYA